MTDVAQMAGVSHQTVSRVVNDQRAVRPDTRDRVLTAMAQLDYRPNPAARALVTGRSKTLGVVTLDTTLYGPASTLFGVEQAARAAGYNITIVSLRSPDRTSIGEAVERLHSQGAEGIIVLAPHVAATRTMRKLPASVPLVSIEGGRGLTTSVVLVDNLGGAETATRHLLDLGHETVWHIAGPPDWPSARAREEGWRTALKAARAPIPAPLIGDWSPGSGYRLGQQLARDTGCTAVFVANDQMALGLLRACTTAGRQVPHDISVVGFDDVPEARYLSPPLTTVRQNFSELSRRSLHLLLEQMDATAHTSSPAVVPVEFVVRESTAPKRARG